mgnify:CR=1 FL=1
MTLKERQAEHARVKAERSEVAHRLLERLSGQTRQPEFELLLLDAAQHAYGTVGRGYLETRFWMAATMEVALSESDDDEAPPQIGNA